MKRFAALALFCGALALNPGTAQDQKTAPPAPTPPKLQRAVYPVTNGDAPLLAEVVGAHFKGEATVIAAPGNAILVSGTAGSVPEVLKLLDQLDRKPRTVEVEVKQGGSVIGQALMGEKDAPKFWFVAAS